MKAIIGFLAMSASIMAQPVVTRTIPETCSPASLEQLFLDAGRYTLSGNWDCGTIEIPELRDDEYVVAVHEGTQRAVTPATKVLKRRHGLSGLRIIIAVWPKMPSKLRQAVDLNSEKSGSEKSAKVMVRELGRYWQAGTYGKGDSILVFLSVSDRGFGISAPKEWEERLAADFDRSPIAVRDIQNIRSAFFRTLNSARRAEVESPATVALIAFISAFEPVAEKYMTPLK